MSKLTNEQRAVLSQAIGPEFLGGQETSLMNAFDAFYNILKPGEDKAAPAPKYVDPTIAENEAKEKKIAELQAEAKATAEAAFPTPAKAEAKPAVTKSIK